MDRGSRSDRGGARIPRIGRGGGAKKRSRVARYRKIKAIDPFAKDKKIEVLKGHNPPRDSQVERGDKPSRSLSQFMNAIQYSDSEESESDATLGSEQFQYKVRPQQYTFKEKLPYKPKRSFAHIGKQANTKIQNSGHSEGNQTQSTKVTTAPSTREKTEVDNKKLLEEQKNRNEEEKMYLAKLKRRKLDKKASERIFKKSEKQEPFIKEAEDGQVLPAVTALPKLAFKQNKRGYEDLERKGQKKPQILKKIKKNTFLLYIISIQHLVSYLLIIFLSF